MASEDLLLDAYLKVLASAKKRGLPTNNIKIFMLPRIADVYIGSKDSIIIGYKDNYSVPIIRDSNIAERKLDDGSFVSDVYILDPDWIIPWPQEKIMTGCRDCEKCTRTTMNSCLITIGRTLLAVCTVLVSEVVIWIFNASKRRCPTCEHPLDIHSRDLEGRFID